MNIDLVIVVMSNKLHIVKQVKQRYSRDKTYVPVY